MGAVASGLGVDDRKLADIRFIGDLMGTYVLLNAGSADGRVEVFSCRARSISAREAVVNAPVAGAVGDPLTVNLEGLGVLQGHVTRVMAGGFAFKINCSDEDALQLATKIEWMKRRKLKTVTERREHKRVLPRETRAMLIMGGGQKMTCMLMDMSQSGVAVSAAVLPKIGTLVAVGAVPGHVARHFEGGFAIHFVELQKLDHLEGLLTLRTDENRVLAARSIAEVAQKAAD